MFSCDKDGKPYCTACLAPMVRAPKYDRGELWNRRVAFKCESCPQLMTIAVGRRERTSAKAHAPSPFRQSKAIAHEGLAPRQSRSLPSSIQDAAAQPSEVTGRSNDSGAIR